MNVTDREYALELDRNDPLAHFKAEFVVSDPQMCYLDGNSLGRMPIATVESINNFLT
ncbi:MAG: aminotransferase, partial [Actinobacteria bacterium]|nr:aminotransferase [Actinomycetota bacterium]